MSRAFFTSLLLSVIFATGCSKLIPKLDEVVPDNRKDYVKAQTLPDLEVPPDLSTDAIRDRMAIPEGGEAARYSTFQERRAAQQRADDLEKAQTSAIRVLENEHVLAVAGAPVQVWPGLQQFWRDQGYELELDDVELGIIETAWLGGESELARSKFKVFAEAGEEPGTTVLYISHENQELVPEGEELVWQRRPRDEEFERTLVERLETNLNGGAVATADPARSVAETDDAASMAAAQPSASSEPAASAAPAATAAAVASGDPRHAELVSVGGGKFYLTVAEDFPSAWKTTGRALEQAGVAVKDSDKGRGVYFVEYGAGKKQDKEEGGVLSKLKFWGGSDADEFQVSLTGVGEKTEVVVLDKNGRWETGETAGDLLNRLHNAMNSGRI